MTEFEIRILTPDGRPGIATTLSLFSAQSAIGAALRLARGRPFEVWGDGRCLYTSIVPAVPPPGDRPAA